MVLVLRRMRHVTDTLRNKGEVIYDYDISAMKSLIRMDAQVPRAARPKKVESTQHECTRVYILTFETTS